MIQAACFLNLTVSIHASSREDATWRAGKKGGRGKVSIHASSREDATSPLEWLLTAGTFQSTRPRGRTRHYDRAVYGAENVSIHASSREDATSNLTRLPSRSSFQSTRPRGRTRPRQVAGVAPCFGFNPRVLAGGRDRRWNAS